ncbi:MAG: hypothetical protein EP330_23755 [Deltaproteobacteria bacterium]|nr:MAG: hypothetical protein EP330_23755 [Deltaproteobacteria bacterium]
MTLGEIPALMGPFLLVELAATLVSVLLAIAVAVRLLQGKPTAGALLAAPVLLPAVVVLAVGALGLAGDPVNGLALNLGTRVLGWFYLWPASLIVLGAAAAASLRAERRELAFGGAVAAATLLVMALPWGYGLPEVDYWPVGLRTGLYAVSGLLCAAAMVGTDAEGGKDPAVAGASVFALLVAGGELAQRGLAFVGVTLRLPGPDKVAVYYERAMTGVVDKFAPWNHATALVALLPLLLAVGLAARSESARMRSLTAAVVLFVAPALYLVGDPSLDAFLALSEAAQ